MDLLAQIVARAKSNKQRIVLPEAEEERTLCAADRALADDIADIVLIGNPAKVEALAKEKGLTHVGKATLIDPENYEKSEELAEKLAEIRKSKGMTIEEARKLIKNPLYLGCMIIKTEGADGQISGALSTTGETLRPDLQIIKCQPGITCVSGGLLLISKQKQYGENGVLVVADVAVTPMPDAAQLSQIAVCTAQMAKAVAGFEDPRVAMLSFSTKGSAKHEVCDKVIEATRLAKELDPTLNIILSVRSQISIKHIGQSSNLISSAFTTDGVNRMISICQIHIQNSVPGVGGRPVFIIRSRPRIITVDRDGGAGIAFARERHGGQAQHHRQSQEQSKQFLHVVFPLFFMIFVGLVAE